MKDILDTSHEGKEVELKPNLVALGDDINITQMDPTIKNILIGVGWDVNNFSGENLDLDISLFMLNKDNETREDADFVYYNNPEAIEGHVRYHGDSRTGAGDGDDETLSINLESLPFEIVTLAFALTIYKGDEKGQNLGLVRNTYIRLVNKDTDHELLRYNMDEDFANRTETAVIVATIDREGPKWHFRPKNDFVEGGLPALVQRHGMIVGQQ